MRISCLNEKYQSEAGKFLRRCLIFGQNLRLKAKEPSTHRYTLVGSIHHSNQHIQYHDHGDSIVHDEEDVRPQLDQSAV